MLSIVVPVYNGKGNILPFIKQIRPAVSSLNEDWELIFVDDGSTDDSLKRIKQAADNDPHIGWISFTQNQGQQLAALCGLRNSRGDRIVTMDDDLDHPAFMIGRLCAELEKGYEAVYAVPKSRKVGGGLMRDLFFSLFLKKPRGLRIGSFRIFSRIAVDRIIQAPQPFVYISAELFRAKLRVSFIEYEKQEDPGVELVEKGNSRYTFFSRLRLYLRLIRGYGPFSSRRAGFQYKIASQGGCL